MNHKNTLNPKLYSKSRTDKAGELLRFGNANEGERSEALTIFSNWRAVHSYPMNIFNKRLKRVSERLSDSSIAAQRLKRVLSIIKKLNRVYSGENATMKLTQIQEQKAIEAYSTAEKKIFEKPEYDVVLVGTDNFKELKSAYPNYFIDTKAFVNKLEKIIWKY